MLEGVKRNKLEDGEQLFCAEATGLFYVKGSDFLPIAIQLIPHNKSYLFTPESPANLWMLAKMHFRCAQSNVHEVCKTFFKYYRAWATWGPAPPPCGLYNPMFFLKLTTWGIEPRVPSSRNC